MADEMTAKSTPLVRRGEGGVAGNDVWGDPLERVAVAQLARDPRDDEDRARCSGPWRAGHHLSPGGPTSRTSPFCAHVDTVSGGLGEVHPPGGEDQRGVGVLVGQGEVPQLLQPTPTVVAMWELAHTVGSHQQHPGPVTCRWAAVEDRASTINDSN